MRNEIKHIRRKRLMQLSVFVKYGEFTVVGLTVRCLAGWLATPPSAYHWMGNLCDLKRLVDLLSTKSIQLRKLL
jgi:hypothetical protein